MLGINFFLKQFDLLHEHTGAVYGAGFADVKVTLWVYRLLMLLSIVSAAVTVVSIKRRRLKTLIKAPLAMAAVGIIGVALSSAVQNLVVAPDELNKEKEYLAQNIEFTQHAYQLDNVSIKAWMIYRVWL